MMRLYNAFHFKGLCNKHRPVASIPSSVLGMESGGAQMVTRGQASAVRPRHQSPRGTLWAPPSGLSGRLGKVTVSWAVFAHFMKEETSPETSESVHGTHSGPYLGQKQRQTHLLKGHFHDDHK